MDNADGRPGLPSQLPAALPPCNFGGQRSDGVRLGGVGSRGALRRPPGPTDQLLLGTPLTPLPSPPHREPLPQPFSSGSNVPAQDPDGELPACQPGQNQEGHTGPPGTPGTGSPQPFRNPADSSTATPAAAEDPLGAKVETNKGPGAPDKPQTPEESARHFTD